MVKAVGFATEHNVDKNALFQYIRRHPREFEGHTAIENKCMMLDEEAVAILEKKYPRPVEIVADDEARLQLAGAMQRIDVLQQRIDQYQQQIITFLQKEGTARSTQILLEERTGEAERLRRENEQLRERITQLSVEKEKERQRSERLMARSLWQRIVNAAK